MVGRVPPKVAWAAAMLASAGLFGAGACAPAPTPTPTPTPAAGAPATAPSKAALTEAAEGFVRALQRRAFTGLDRQLAHDVVLTVAHGESGCPDDATVRAELVRTPSSVMAWLRQRYGSSRVVAPELFACAGSCCEVTSGYDACGRLYLTRLCLRDAGAGLVVTKLAFRDQGADRDGG